MTVDTAKRSFGISLVPDAIFSPPFLSELQGELEGHNQTVSEVVVDNNNAAGNNFDRGNEIKQRRHDAKSTTKTFCHLQRWNSSSTAEKVRLL